MTDPSYTHFTMVGDRTGSMGSLSEPNGPSKAEIATKGFADFMKEQSVLSSNTNLAGKTTWTFYEFHTKSDCSTPDIQRIAHMQPAPPIWKCQPGNMTPLLDALGTAINETGADLAALPEDQRPSRVYVVVATDGLENASKEYSKDALRKLIEQQRNKYNWEFVFIGADIDSFSDKSAGGMGISRSSILNTNSSSPGAMAAAYASTSSAVTRSRKTGESVEYSTVERHAAEQGTSSE